MVDTLLTTVDADAAPETDADFNARIAALLGDLDPGWQDALVIEARQDELAARGHLVGERAINVLARMVELRRQGLQPGPDDPIIAAFAGELCGLDTALRGYATGMQRDDGEGIVRAAVALSAGEGAADFVMRVLERGRMA